MSVSVDLPGEWTLEPNEADVRRCLENARRIRRDARRCRSPARLALYELSLEQSALAAMVFFRLEVNDRLRRGGLAADRRDDAPRSMTGYLDELSRHAPSLNDRAIDLAFRRHFGSLTEFKFVLELIEKVVPRTLSGPEPPASKVAEAPALYVAVYRLARRSRAKRAITRYLEKMAQDIRALDVERLDKTVKNNSLYARIDPTSGRVVIPTHDARTARTVARASNAVEKFVLGLLTGRLMAQRRETKVSERTAVA
jgi:hypothetical protein